WKVLLRSCLVFFFFQAEDGIRDRNVTGVQTCALPISGHFCGLDAVGFKGSPTDFPDADCRHIRKDFLSSAFHKSMYTGSTGKDRSEERRVGKECGYPGRPGR